MDYLPKKQFDSLHMLLISWTYISLKEMSITKKKKKKGLEVSCLVFLASSYRLTWNYLSFHPFFLIIICLSQEDKDSRGVSNF